MIRLFCILATSAVILFGLGRVAPQVFSSGWQVPSTVYVIPWAVFVFAASLITFNKLLPGGHKGKH